MWIPPVECWPSLVPYTQRFDTSRIDNVSDTVQNALEQCGAFNAVQQGQSVAITAGSRGIDRIAEVTKAIVDSCIKRGLHPFIVPAMGSHGGATAKGQTVLLADLGITHESMGVPVRASMEVSLLGTTEAGIPVYMDTQALSADHIILANRVKAHTKFKAELESGLFKMACIGLGKHKGAALYHKLAIRHGFGEVIRTAGALALRNAPILCGLAMVENAYGRLHTLNAYLPHEIEQGEKQLLCSAKKLAGKLPFAEIDLLIVDEMGKNISGTGMDVNVTGRNRDIMGDFETPLHVKRIAVLDLTPESHGNANGIGYADVTTDRLINSMDYAKTVTNSLTAISPEKAAIPIHCANDKDALSVALNTLGEWNPDTVRIVRIKNTSKLEQLLVSPALHAEVEANNNPKPQQITFTQNGNLPEFNTCFTAT